MYDREELYKLGHQIACFVNSKITYFVKSPSNDKASLARCLLPLLIIIFQVIKNSKKKTTRKKRPESKEK